MVISNNFQNAGKFVQTYSFNEFATKEGFVEYFPTVTEDTTIADYVMSARALTTSSTSGKVGVNSTVQFNSAAFLTTQTVKGAAFVSGYADYDSGAGVSAAFTILKTNFDNVAQGSSLVTNASEVTQVEGSAFVLKKTLGAGDGYVYSVDSDVKNLNGGTTQLRHEFVYINGQTVQVDQTFTETSYTTYNTLNPYPALDVSQVKIYLYASTGGTPPTAYEKNTEVFGVTGEVSESLGSAASPVTTVDRNFLLEIPLTTTVFKVGDILQLKMVTTGGGSGTIVVDPTNSIVSENSLNLLIPFLLDL